MNESTLLMISDDPTLVGSVAAIVRPIEGLEIACLEAVGRARSFDGWDRVAMVVVHVVGGESDPEVARVIRRAQLGALPVATLAVLDRPQEDRAAWLLRQGVAECLVRPLDLERLGRLIEGLTAGARGLGQAPIPTEDEEIDPPTANLVSLVAPSDATILIGGEAGTGKTRLARRIHDQSARADGPFLTIRCGSLTIGQVESELFGQPRWLSDNRPDVRAGKLAEAARGTLFLDDVDALPMSIQPRLLQAIETSAIGPGGVALPASARPRLIAATRLDLAAEVEQGRFRSDLYYRLLVVGLVLPPLRDRKEMIAGLASRFLAGSPSRPGSKISFAALRALEDYDWPGNVRELKAAIERAVLLGNGGEVGLADLPPTILRRAKPPEAREASASEVPSTLAEIKRDAEYARITAALRKHSNNRLRTASELGISRMTLYKKLYKYGLMQHSSDVASPGR
jgi:DNA-binding NtrC family response regulator